MKRLLDIIRDFFFPPVPPPDERTLKWLQSELACKSDDNWFNDIDFYDETKL